MPHLKTPEDRPARKAVAPKPDLSAPGSELEEKIAALRRQIEDIALPLQPRQSAA